MILSEFHTLVRDAIGRGTVVDSQITSYTRQAARWIERNFTFEYMKKWAEVTVNPDAAFPHILDMPSTRVKSFKFVRIVEGDGNYIYLNKIDPKDVKALIEDVPSGYYVDGTSRIILDVKPGEEYLIEVCYYEYTEWSADTGFTHWLFDNAEDVLLAQTLLNYAPFARDARMRDAFKETRDEGMKTLGNSIVDAEFDDADMVMGYSVFTRN